MRSRAIKSVKVPSFCHDLFDLFTSCVSPNDVSTCATQSETFPSVLETRRERRNKSKSTSLNYLLSRPLRTEARSFNTRVRNVGWREIKGASANPRLDRQPSAPAGQSQPSRVPTFRWEPRPDWPAGSDVIGVAPKRVLPIGWRPTDVRVPQVTGIARWALVVQVESGSGEQQRISVAVRGAPPVYIIQKATPRLVNNT